MIARLIIAAAFGLLLPGIAGAAEIKLLASRAVSMAYLELIPRFETASGHKVSATWANTPEIQKRIAAGEAFDLFILGDEGTRELVKQGKFAAGNSVNFAKSRIGVAVRAGAPRPDVGSSAAVKKSVLAAKSVAYSGGASGIYIARMFEKLGISEEVKAKTVRMKPGEAVGEVVARGDAEIGFHQVSELMPVKGIQYLGPLPADLQHITVFTGGIHSGAKEKPAAEALVKFLTAPAAANTIKKHGLEPG